LTCAAREFIIVGNADHGERAGDGTGFVARPYLR